MALSVRSGHELINHFPKKKKKKKEREHGEKTYHEQRRIAEANETLTPGNQTLRKEVTTLTTPQYNIIPAKIDIGTRGQDSQSHDLPKNRKRDIGEGTSSFGSPSKVPNV